MKKKIQVIALAAKGNKVELLARQACLTQAQIIGIYDKQKYQAFKNALQYELQVFNNKKIQSYKPEIICGINILVQISSIKNLDMVFNSMDGSIGLESTLATLKNNHILALANKESIVSGCSLVTDLASNDQIIPLDSEHAALKQCLKFGNPSEVDRLILTASGGPFLNKNKSFLSKVTVKEALKHPVWKMGKIISINSASLVNKGLEIIEAHVLFNIPIDQIDVVIHPQAMIHSMVQFIDGSIISQCYPPNMTIPIGLALNWPKKIPGLASSCSWNQFSQWTFYPVNEELFPAIKLAKYAIKCGKTFPTVYNAANEEAVKAFCNREISFLKIANTIEAVLSAHNHEREFSLETIRRAEKWAKQCARNYFN